MLTIKNSIKVESLKEAYELNQKKSSTILGGMLWLKMQSKNIQTGIDLSGLGLDTIEETEEEFRIGAMCTLRMLETHDGLNTTFQGVFKESVRHIVGVQFRNCATVGGSVFGRYGFSDVLTCLLALHCEVELYKKGIVPLDEFVKMPYERDVLVRILIKKDERYATYSSLRASATDFPIVACAVSKKGNQWFVAIGARPGKATVVMEERSFVTKEVLSEDNTVNIKLLEEEAQQFGQQIASQIVFGSNMRGSSQYREHIAAVYVKRAVLKILGGNDSDH